MTYAFPPPTWRGGEALKSRGGTFLPEGGWGEENYGVGSMHRRALLAGARTHREKVSARVLRRGRGGEKEVPFFIALGKSFSHSYSPPSKLTVIFLREAFS